LGIQSYLFLTLDAPAVEVVEVTEAEAMLLEEARDFLLI
jgi:hypothetical protein